MGCTTNPSTDGFTAVSAVTSHDRLPWLFVDTAVLLGMFPHLQKTTVTGGDLGLASSIYFYLITLPRPSFQIRSYFVLEEAFFSTSRLVDPCPMPDQALRMRGASRPVRCHLLEGAQFHWKWQGLTCSFLKPSTQPSLPAPQ